MDIREGIRNRRSIRGFKPDAVPAELLRQVLDDARFSPSSVNSQPWEVIVLTGQRLDRIKEHNIEAVSSGREGAPEMGPHLGFEGKYVERQRESAARILTSMGIAREDKARRMAWREKGTRFFEAPAAVILVTERTLNPARAYFDIGMFVQTFCLAAPARGLGTCIMNAGVSFPDIIRKITGLPETKRIVVAIAVGYPDPNFPPNKLQPVRAPVAEFTTWLGFDQTGQD